MPGSIIGEQIPQPIAENNVNNRLIEAANAGAQAIRQAEHDDFVSRQNNLRTVEAGLDFTKTLALGTFSGLAGGLIATALPKLIPFLSLGGPLALFAIGAILTVGVFMAAQAITNYTEAGGHIALGNRTPEEAINEANKQSLEGVRNPMGLVGLVSRH